MLQPTRTLSSLFLGYAGNATHLFVSCICEHSLLARLDEDLHAFRDERGASSWRERGTALPASRGVLSADPQCSPYAGEGVELSSSSKVWA